MTHPIPVLTFGAIALAASCCQASPLPFGTASAFNVIAVGSSTLSGTVSTNSDIGGRVAAASSILSVGTVGATLNGDPFGSAASGFAFVSPGGYTGSTVNINGGGNAYAPGASASKFNFANESPQGSLQNTIDPINFASLASSLDAESTYLGSLSTSSGATIAPNSPTNNQLILTGSNGTLDAFDISAAQFGNANQSLDIFVPTTATVIVNVSGSNDSLGSGLYINGNQTSGDTTAGEQILFNFSTATSLTINSQFDASVLAPFAAFSGNGQLDGNLIAAQVDSTGEVHNEEFDGTLPSASTATPEPDGIFLLGTGLLSVAGLIRQRLKNQG